MESFTKREFRTIILYNFKRQLPDFECYNEMRGCFGDNSPSLRTIQRWYLQFRRGVLTLEDDPRSGRPHEAVTQNNIDAIRKLIEQDRHISYRMIEHILKISASAVHTILHEHLKVRKLCSLWIPHSLTVEQKLARIDWCRNTFKKFNGGFSKSVSSVVTGDETWIHYYDIPTRAQSKQWVFEDESTPTLVKSAKSVNKRMFAVFFSRSGPVAQVMLVNKKTVTANWYIDHCLPIVFETLKNKRPNSRSNTWFLHHDNAPAHRASKTIDFIENSGVKLLDHPPYSPDLAPCDFSLFSFIKRQLKGKHFDSEEALIYALEDTINDIPKEKWSEIFDEWFRRMNKCIIHGGEYFEKL